MTSQVRNFRINALGRAGIWVGDDDAPFNYPRDHLDRVKFHTDLDYIQTVREVPLLVSLPAVIVGTNRAVAESYPLFDHGQAGFPFVLGKITLNSITVGFAGSVPVQRPRSVGATPIDLQRFARWISLGADNTTVYIHSYAVGGGNYDAIDVPITVYVTSELLDVDTPRPRVGSATRISINRVQFADGLFDTNKQYIRQVANPADRTLTLVRGSTFESAKAISGGHDYLAWRWRMGDLTQTAIAGISESVGQWSGPVGPGPNGLLPPDGFNSPLDIGLGDSDFPATTRDSFRASGGRIRMASGGRTRFDTDDGLFHTINSLSGTIPVLGYSFASGDRVDATDDVDLGPCDPNCTDIIGSIKFTSANYDAGMAFDRWTTMFGGSAAVWVMDGFSLAPMSNPVQLVWYYFFIDSGRVKFRRRAVCTDDTRGTYTILAHSIDYKLKTGLFT